MPGIARGEQASVTFRAHYELLVGIFLGRCNQKLVEVIAAIGHRGHESGRYDSSGGFFEPSRRRQFQRTPARKFSTG